MPQPEHKRWYSTAAWQRRRAGQIAAEPLCRMCEEDGRVEPATIADHVEPHRGDPAKFWDGALQSLCKRHHDSEKQRIERGGEPTPARGANGWPLQSV